MSARAGSEHLRRGSGAAKRPDLRLPAAVQNEQTVYDIIYDINVYDINVGTVLTHINDVLQLVFYFFLVIAGFDIDLRNGLQFIFGCVWIRPCLVFCMY